MEERIMDKVTIVFWSQSGNTESMANAVAEGVTAAGKEAVVVDVASASLDDLKAAKGFAMGCPAMGAEVLEEGEMEPFVCDVEGFAAGKTIALFGSYGWGDGQWMRDWAEMLFHIPSFHEAGYICSMLFIIPGFPFITSGIDLAKLDLRSGLERLTYSVIIVLVATMFAWIMALLLKLQPQDFSSLSIDPVLHLLLRLITSFCGVFGFSIMFNSSIPMAATAAFIGAIANTLRLELVNFTATPAAVAAFIGALTAGLLASIIKKWNGYPRISLTVPSIVIMVPGLYLYRAIYNFGIMSLTEAVSWFAAAIMIIIALPLGLIFARILTDRTFRYCT